MSILITTKTVPIRYFILPANLSNNTFIVSLMVIIDIFYPSSEPISLQSLRCSLLAVVYYSFVGHCLAFATLVLGWGGLDRE